MKTIYFILVVLLVVGAEAKLDISLKELPSEASYNMYFKKTAYPKSIDKFFGAKGWQAMVPESYLREGKFINLFNRAYYSETGGIVLARSGMSAKGIQHNQVYVMQDSFIVHFKHPKMKTITLHLLNMKAPKALQMAQRIYKRFAVEELKRNPWVEALNLIGIQKAQARVLYPDPLLNRENIERMKALGLKVGGKVKEATGYAATTAVAAGKEVSRQTRCLEGWYDRKHRWMDAYTSNQNNNRLFRCAVGAANGLLSLGNPFKIWEGIKSVGSGLKALGSAVVSPAAWMRGAANARKLALGTVEYARKLRKALPQIKITMEGVGRKLAAIGEVGVDLCKWAPAIAAAILTGGWLGSTKVGQLVNRITSAIVAKVKNPVTTAAVATTAAIVKGPIGSVTEKVVKKVRGQDRAGVVGKAAGKAVESLPHVLRVNYLVNNCEGNIECIRREIKKDPEYLRRLKLAEACSPNEANERELIDELVTEVNPHGIL